MIKKQNKQTLGMKGVKKKWQKSVMSDILRLGLPMPDHPYGFSSNLLAVSLPKGEYTKLQKWLFGQTCMLDKMLGIITYTNDVIRGLDAIRNGISTYFD